MRKQLSTIKSSQAMYLLEEQRPSFDTKERVKGEKSV